MFLPGKRREKKNHAVPIYLSRTDKNRPFQYGCCPAKAVSNLLQSLVEGGGFFGRTKFGKHQGREGVRLASLLIRHHLKNSFFRLRVYFFLLAVDVVVGPRRFGPSLGLHRGGRYGILAPFQSSYPPDSVTRRLSHCVVSHCERFCQQNFFFFSREFLARGLASRPSFLPPPKFLCENRLGRKREKVVKILLGGGGFSS